MYFTLRILNGHKVYLILTCHKVSTDSFVCAAELETEHSPLSPGNFNLLQATSALFCLRSKSFARPPLQHKHLHAKKKKISFKGLIVVKTKLKYITYLFLGPDKYNTYWYGSMTTNFIVPLLGLKL